MSICMAKCHGVVFVHSWASKYIGTDVRASNDICTDTYASLTYIL